MKNLYTTIAFFLLPLTALADGETLHLRPASACTFDGDGTAYACAASGGAAGAWTSLTGFNDTTKLHATDTAGEIDPGDTLCIHGSIDGQLTFGETGVAGTLGSGSIGSPIVIDFACSDESGSLDPTSANYAFYSEQTYITLNEPTGSGPTTLGNVFYFAEGGGSQDKQVIVNGGHIDDCQVATGESCLYMGGDNFTVTGLLCTEVEFYCVLSNGTGNTIQNSLSIQVAADGGSCFLLDAETDDALLQHNSCVKSAVGGACYEINDQTPVASTAPTLIANNCYQSGAVTSGRGYLIKGPSNIYGGYVTGANRAFEIDDSGGGQVGAVVIAGVTAVNIDNSCVFIGTNWTDVTVSNNTLSDCGLRAVWSFNTSASIVYTNNIFEESDVGLDETTASSNVNSYNVFFNNTTNDREVGGSMVAIDGTSITSDPSLDAAYLIDRDSSAWGAGTTVTPWYGRGAECSGATINVGASCALQVSPQFRD